MYPTPVYSGMVITLVGHGWLWFRVSPGGGGGGYSVWKRVGPTDCCPTAGERWLSRPMTAKKKKGGGAVLLLYCRIGELSE